MRRSAARLGVQSGLPAVALLAIPVGAVAPFDRSAGETAHDVVVLNEAGPPRAVGAFTAAP